LIVALDANALVKWSTLPEDDIDKARLSLLLEEVGKASGRIVIPMPCFAEFLVKADEAAAAWLDAFERRRAVVLAPLDRRAAFECALFDRAALGGGDKRAGRKGDPWQKIKIDRQVVAISKVAGATGLISSDEGLRSTARSAGLHVTHIAELPAPESAKQVKLPFEGAPLAK
jgi:hypothetical protein